MNYFEGQTTFLQDKIDCLWNCSRLQMLNTNSTILRPVSLSSQFDIFANSAKKNLHYFCKTLYRSCGLTGFWICLRSWIYQGSEYDSGFEYARVLNISGIWIFQGSEYATILNIPRLHRLLNVSENIPG